MTTRSENLPRLLKPLRKRWNRLTQGTTRAAGVSMCLLLLCAVVVGGSQVMPFASVRNDEALPTSEVSHEVDESPETSDVAVRQLERTDYNESWLQAGNDWDRLGDVKRRHQVLITPGGQLTGRIMTFADWQGDVKPLSNAAVHLMQNGRVAAETSTDADGRFVADGLSEGTYSLISESPDGLLAYALHLHTAQTDAEAIEFQLESLAATAWDTESIIGRVFDYWQTAPPIVRTREPAGETIPDPVRPIPQQGAAATTLLQHRVRLQEDGRLIGRLRRLHPTTGRPIIAREIEVAIFRNGSLQGVTWTDDIGYFEFSRVAPGVYSLVATGSISTGPAQQISLMDERGLKQGFLAFGLEVLPADDSLIVPVAFGDGAVLEIDAALVDVADLQPFLGNNAPESEAAAGETPFASNGGGSGATGGGGGVGGGSGLGALLAAGAAAGLVALLDDVISPSRP